VRKSSSLFLIALATGCSWAETASATSYYVSVAGSDAATGTSQSTAWQTFTNINNIKTVFKPGDTISFRCGDTFQGQLVVNNSGSGSQPITFTSYADPKAKVTACTQTTYPLLEGATDALPLAAPPAAPTAVSTAAEAAITSTIYAANVDNIIFSNLHIRNNANTQVNLALTNFYGIYVVNTGATPLNNFLFADLLIDEVAPYAFPSSTSTDFNGVISSGIAVSNISSGSINNITVENSTFINNGRFGASFVDSGGVYNQAAPVENVQNVVFQNNVCANNGGSCIWGQRVENLLIQGNSIAASGVKKAVSPIANATPDVVAMVGRGSGGWFSGSQHVAVEGNTVLGSEGPGDSSNIHVDGGNSDVVVEYNQYYGSAGAGFEVLGNNSNVIFRFNYSVDDGQRNPATAGNGGAGTIYSSNFVPDTAYMNSSGKAEIGYLNSHTVTIYNNAFVSDMSTPATLPIAVASTSFDVVNNIFASYGSSYVGPVTPVGNATMVWSDNVYYNSAATATSTSATAVAAAASVASATAAVATLDTSKNPIITNPDFSTTPVSYTPSVVTNFVTSLMATGATTLSPVPTAFPLQSIPMALPAPAAFVTGLQLPISGSPATGKALNLKQPAFAAAGQGIFANIEPIATTNFFDTALQMSVAVPATATTLAVPPTPIISNIGPY
jgi:hypothetical protein